MTQVIRLLNQVAGALTLTVAGANYTVNHVNYSRLLRAKEQNRWKQIDEHIGIGLKAGCIGFSWPILAWLYYCGDASDRSELSQTICCYDYWNRDKDYQELSQ